MVNQIISAIPQPGKRGIDARTTFVTKQEAFQDHLYDNTVDELNTFAGEVNNTAVAVNTTLNSSIIVRDQTTQKASEASTSATLASQKASEASSSANQALTYKNQLQGYVIPTGTSYSVEQINTQNSAMPKAQFLALSEERKANRAGSGFEEWGKHFADNSVVINEGMWTASTYQNKFVLGRNASGVGNSKTTYPVININGVLQKILYTNTSSVNNAEIQLPPAPTIYPHDTVLTPEQIASGVIKHADASNSGLVLVGKNLTGTTFNQTVTVVNGKKYLIEYKDNAVRKTLEVTASSTSYIISLSGTDITEVGMYPLDAISRSDLVFPESYHEDIAEKGFGYPFGNVQYLGGNTDGLTGITNGAFSGFETYSLFGKIVA